VDQERLALGAAMGFPQTDGMEIFHRYYGHREWDSWHTFFTQSLAHGGNGPSAPPSLQHRYLTEDIPYALVPMTAVGEVMGVPMPHMNALVTLACTGIGENYRETGRSLKRLGLEGLNKEQIIRRFVEGK